MYLTSVAEKQTQKNIRKKRRCNFFSSEIYIKTRHFVLCIGLVSVIFVFHLKYSGQHYQRTLLLTVPFYSIKKKILRYENLIAFQDLLRYEELINDREITVGGKGINLGVALFQLNISLCIFTLDLFVMFCL